MLGRYLRRFQLQLRYDLCCQWPVQDGFAVLLPPWDDPKAEYTAESLDTAVVTVTVHGQRVTFTARNPGQTAVRVRATLVGERNTGLFNYNVITTAPIDPQM